MHRRPDAARLGRSRSLPRGDRRLARARAAGEGVHAGGRGRRAARRRARGGVGRARRTVHRDRQLLRAFHDVAGGRRAGRRDRRVRRRPSPWFGGEPGRVGAPRSDGRRSPHRPDGHARVLPAHPPRCRTRGARRRRRRPVVGGGRALARRVGGAGVHRRRPRGAAGHRRLRGVDAEGRARAGPWRSTTSSPTRPTAGDRPTSGSTCRRWRAAGSAEVAATGSLRVLRRIG